MKNTNGTHFNIFFLFVKKHTLIFNICTTHVTTTFFLFLLDKNNGERKKKRENKNTCKYERESCFNSYQKVDVQIFNVSMRELFQ